MQFITVGPVVRRQLSTALHVVTYTVTILHEVDTSHLYLQPVWSLHTDSDLLHIEEKSAVLWVDKKGGRGENSGGSLSISFLHLLSIPPSLTLPSSLSNFHHLHLPLFPSSSSFFSSSSCPLPFPLLNLHLPLLLLLSSSTRFSSSPGQVGDSKSIY